MAISSELIQIIVAAIYAITLFYTIVTFQRSKRVDQITSLGDVMNELRDVDRELEKIPSGSQFGDVRNSWYIRMFNSLEWLSFMINERMITDKKLIEYIKPVIISYYEDTFLKSGSASERESSRYQQFKKLYQTMKKQV
ncbi:MAG: hypothetical protein WBW34_09945 [Nitrososphaeraceae archaeon]|jgi:hypothetical protein